MSRSSSQGTSATSGQGGQAENCARPRRHPASVRDSSTTCGSPRVAAASSNARSFGWDSSEARRSKRANAADSSMHRQNLRCGSSRILGGLQRFATSASSRPLQRMRIALDQAPRTAPTRSLRSPGTIDRSGAVIASDTPPACRRAHRAAIRPLQARRPRARPARARRRSNARRGARRPRRARRPWTQRTDCRP